MKVWLLLCLLSTLLIPGLADDNAISLKRFQTAQSTELQRSQCDTDLDQLCNICIEYADDYISYMLFIIRNSGIIDYGCDYLCETLAEKTNNDLAGKVCNVFCAHVGINQLKKFLQQADFDSIYYCKLLGVCVTTDNGDAQITNAFVNPTSGRQGEFAFQMTFNTANGTGTGEMAIFIETVDGIPYKDTEIICYSPGTYGVGWTVNAKPDPVCKQPPCEKWLPGTYKVTLAVCYGECDSSNPHSVIYDEAYLTFEITR